MDLQLTSTAFQEGQPIPPVYTADGLNKSPPLKWNEPPGGTKALALVCEDPDAPKGTFTHWVAFNIPPETRELGEGLQPGQQLTHDAAALRFLEPGMQRRELDGEGVRGAYGSDRA